MAEVVLDRPGIAPIVGQLEAAAMPQHVPMDEEGEAGRRAGPGNHSLVAGHTGGAKRSDTKMWVLRALSGVARWSLRSARSSLPVSGWTLAAPSLLRRTCSLPAWRSTSSQRSPTSSLARSPWR